MLSRLLSGQRKTKDNSDKPKALRNGAYGRTGEGAAVIVHVQGKVPTASFLAKFDQNGHRLSIPRHSSRGAFMSATSAPEMGDGAGGDVFALFEASPKAVTIVRFFVMSPRAGGRFFQKACGVPRGRVSGTLTEWAPQQMDPRGSCTWHG